MRIPTFSRQSDTTAETEDRAPVSARTDTPPTPTRASAPVQADNAPAGKPAADRAATGDDRTTTVITKQREAKPQDATTTQLKPVPPAPVRATEVREPDTRPDLAPAPVPTQAPVVAGPKPRASLLAMLGLITGVVAALLVLSGPLLGYGVGVAGLALVLSLAGIHATRKRHVAGKTDALIGMVLSLAAIVVGVFALTGSLSWLGTDMQPVNSLREWLDTQFVDRF